MGTRKAGRTCRASIWTMVKEEAGEEKCDSGKDVDADVRDEKGRYNDGPVVGAEVRGAWTVEEEATDRD